MFAIEMSLFNKYSSHYKFAICQSAKLSAGV